LWQYANRGRIAGISRPVDLNVFNGDESGWRRFRQPVFSPASEIESDRQTIHTIHRRRAL